MTTTTRPPARPTVTRSSRGFTPGRPRTRLKIALVGVLMMLSLVATRAVEIQTIQGPTLAAEGSQDRSRTVVVPAVRGTITDRSGAALAMSVAARNVTVDQTLVTDPAAEAASLASVLGGDAATYAARLTGTRRFAYVVKNITPQQWSSVEALQLAGIYSEASTTRVYPAGETAANVIGFVGADGNGLGGLEYGFQQQLAGTAGLKEYQASARGQEIPTAGQSGTDVVPGLGIQLTIDSDLQWEAQQAIAQAVASARADWGQVTVMDPATGQILALATVPTFDPADPGATPPDDRGNRALSDAYEPGSTGKVMTMAAIIDQHAASATTPFVVPSTLTRGGKVFHDAESHGTLKLTLAGILARSSNIGTIEASEKIGGDTLYSYLQKFGVGDPTGLQFPGENDGSVPAPAAWSATTFPTLAFGQGLSMNSVQATSVFATIANNGVRVTPSLVQGFVRPDGSFQPAQTPTSTRVVSASTASTVRTMLEAVVSDKGTAPQAAIDGYRVAGKTATAQRVDPTCGCYRGYVSSFIGMAPADAPKVVVGVTLNNPRVGKFGSVLAAPVFKQVMTFALQELHVVSTGTDLPRVRTTW